jgi:hypothetical protein
MLEDMLDLATRNTSKLATSEDDMSPASRTRGDSLWARGREGQ